MRTNSTTTWFQNIVRIYLRTHKIISLQLYVQNNLRFLFNKLIRNTLAEFNSYQEKLNIYNLSTFQEEKGDSHPPNRAKTNLNVTKRWPQVSFGWPQTCQLVLRQALKIFKQTHIKQKNLIFLEKISSRSFNLYWLGN